MSTSVHKEITHHIRQGLCRQDIALNLIPVQRLVNHSGLGIREGPEIRGSGINTQKLVRTLLKGGHGDAFVCFAARIRWVVNVSPFESQHNWKKQVEACHS